MSDSCQIRWFDATDRKERLQSGWINSELMTDSVTGAAAGLSETSLSDGGGAQQHQTGESHHWVT